MPLHSTRTGASLHYPMGAYQAGVTLDLPASQANAYRIDSAASASLFRLSTVTDADTRYPLVLGGSVNMDVQLYGPLSLYVQSAPTVSNAGRGQIYTRTVSAVAELHYRDSGGTEVQLTSGGAILGGFDATDIPIGDNIDPALRVYQGANDYIRIDTGDGAEELTIGNATTNPTFILAGTGLLTMGGSAFELGDGSNNFRIGDGSTIGSGVSNSLVVGVGASLGNSVTDAALFGRGSAISAGQYCAGFGASIAISASYGSAFGYGAVTGTSGGTALGAQTNASGGGVALGRGSTATTGQLVAGSGAAPLTEIVFGEGNTDASPPTVTIRTTDASGTDTAAAPLQLRGGRSTGTAAGGSLVLQVSPAAAGTSATLNSARDVVTVAAAGTSGAQVRMNTTSSDRGLASVETFRLQTTDAGPNTAWSLDTAAWGDGGGHIVVVVSSVISGAGDHAAYELRYAIVRNGATLSVAALSGGGEYESGGAGGWDAVVVASGDSIRVSVTSGGTDPQEWIGRAEWMFAAQP